VQAIEAETLLPPRRMEEAKHRKNSIREYAVKRRVQPVAIGAGDPPSHLRSRRRSVVKGNRVQIMLFDGQTKSIDEDVYLGNAPEVV
jgi:hypothetical protein